MYVLFAVTALVLLFEEQLIKISYNQDHDITPSFQVMME